MQRPALVPRLMRSTEELVLVSAPAGSGKTSALMQWAARESRPTAWLRLDVFDDDPVTLLRYLAAVLDPVVGIEPEVFELLLGRAPSLDARVFPGIAAAVAAARPFVLVLDDCHLMQDERCWRYIEQLLAQLPEGGQLALATREDPPLPLARLRAQGQLAEFRFNELAFSLGEAAELLSLHAVQADEDVVTALLGATEGWATGLYLALLAGRDRPGRDGPGVDHPGGEWPARVRGDQRAIAAYLLEEVLERQPRELQVFLLRTSILDEMSAPLCAAVTGRADCGAVLAKLATGNLFVSTTGENDEWYRYHHLFAELLRSRLERDGAELVPELQRRAATWHEAHGDPAAAIWHWVAAGEIGRTVSLVGRTCPRGARSMRRATIRPGMRAAKEEG